MDYKQEYISLIGTSMVVLLLLLLTVLAVMLIYRKRKMEHVREIGAINEKFGKELLQTQMEVQQQTMKHIGREIHDNVGQKLTLAVLYVQQLEVGDVFKGQLESIANIIHESLADLRSLSKHLTNTEQLQGDLSQLIEGECAKVRATRICQAVLEVSGKSYPVSVAVKSFVLRIVQEFMQNSLKHSGCTVIRLQMREAAGGLEICATDNGKGFVVGGEGRNSGVGLENMRRRAEILQAELSLDSNLGEGTRLRLLIPFRQLSI